MALVFAALIGFWFCLPRHLFDAPISLVVEDRNGKLIGARLAADEQWRFEPIQDVPEKFRSAIICFEDKRFERHWGVDLKAMIRAMRTNLKARQIVSGGSTLTMQLMRLSRGQKPRNIRQKLIESVMALRAEIRFSKDEILNQYVSYAPFGGNVIGLEAASWRYFGKSPELLSWSESATLAVLPNAPSLIHPGRNRDRLLEKRNGLLDRLETHGIITQDQVDLAKLEPIPPRPFDLPMIAPHFTDYLSRHENGRIVTTLDRQLQESVDQLVAGHHRILRQNDIHNLAALVIDTESGEVRAYIGNVAHPENAHENAVDMIQAERSSGSILKPILYAKAMQKGLIMPSTLLRDVPTVVAGYRPENFNRSYEGVVPADEALARSLNVPAVNLLRSYGVDQFREDLIDLDFSSIHYSSEYYGLPLILGGAEVTLWDLANTYRAMGRMLSHAYLNDHQYSSLDSESIGYVPREPVDPEILSLHPDRWHYGALWATFDAMKEVRRPNGTGGWEVYRSAQDVYWKTGTSYGHRDAWAVGVTGKFTVAVWVGNADGEGRPGLVGVKAAAPVLFDIFRLLPQSEPFEAPHDALREQPVCHHSGHPASVHCEQIDTILVPAVDYQLTVCPYHQTIWTDATEKWRVDPHTFEDPIVKLHSFQLDPHAAYYYRQYHPEYKDLPEFKERSDGIFVSADEQLEIVYPPEGAEIYIPKQRKSRQEMICQATPRDPAEVLYWYLDRTFIGTTQEFHSVMIEPDQGHHQLTVTAPSGMSLSRNFVVLSE